MELLSFVFIRQLDPQCAHLNREQRADYSCTAIVSYYPVLLEAECHPRPTGSLKHQQAEKSRGSQSVLILGSFSFTLELRGLTLEHWKSIVTQILSTITSHPSLCLLHSPSTEQLPPDGGVGVQVVLGRKIKVTRINNW